MTLPQVKGILKPPFHYLRQKFANIHFQWKVERELSSDHTCMQNFWMQFQLRMRCLKYFNFCSKTICDLQTDMIHSNQNYEIREEQFENYQYSSINIHISILCSYLNIISLNGHWAVMTNVFQNKYFIIVFLFLLVDTFIIIHSFYHS